VAVPKNSPSGKGKGTVPPGGFTKKDERLRARIEGKVLSLEEAGELLKRLEVQLNTLRMRYEQFFLGLDRAPPDKERDYLKKQIDDLQFMVGKNTGLKFSVQSLFSRFLSYERMWQRTQKDIEDGRYTRDLFKARLHRKHREETDPDISIVTDEPEEPLPPAPPPKVAASRPPALASTIRPSASPPVPRAGTGPSMLPSEDRLRAVYQAYVSAKKQCKESTAGMSFEQVADQLRQQVPQILAQTKAKAIDFKVVIKDGKATLRALPKE
jgi:hypothetical protein